MTSLPEYEPFPINLYGPQGFQPMRSGYRQGDYEEEDTFSLNKCKTNFIVQKVSVRANHVGDVATVTLIYSLKPHPRVS